MKTEYILYGLKKDEPNWKEDIMYVSFNLKDMERAKKLSQKKGYVKFRVAKFTGEAPNFNDPKLINMEVI
jgi:hypothetical protein|tara:strand:+ start:326 stop:535 length:210 start_codon:yes stop_codon:yes gene_type:complete